MEERGGLARQAPGFRENADRPGVVLLGFRLRRARKEVVVILLADGRRDAVAADPVPAELVEHDRARKDRAAGIPSATERHADAAGGNVAERVFRFAEQIRMALDGRIGNRVDGPARVDGPPLEVVRLDAVRERVEPVLDRLVLQVDEHDGGMHTALSHPCEQLGEERIGVAGAVRRRRTSLVEALVHKRLHVAAPVRILVLYQQAHLVAEVVPKVRRRGDAVAKGVPADGLDLREKRAHPLAVPRLVAALRVVVEAEEVCVRSEQHPVASVQAEAARGRIGVERPHAETARHLVAGGLHGQGLEDGVLGRPAVSLPIKAGERNREHDLPLLAGREFPALQHAHGVGTNGGVELRRHGVRRTVLHGGPHVDDARLKIGARFEPPDSRPAGEEKRHRVGDALVVVETLGVAPTVRHRPALAVLQPGVAEPHHDLVFDAGLEKRTYLRFARDEVVWEEPGLFAVHEHGRAERRLTDAERHARRKLGRRLPRGAAPEGVRHVVLHGGLHQRPVSGHGNGARECGRDIFSPCLRHRFGLPRSVQRNGRRRHWNRRGKRENRHRDYGAR